MHLENLQGKVRDEDEAVERKATSRARLPILILELGDQLEEKVRAGGASGPGGLVAIGLIVTAPRRRDATVAFEEEEGRFAGTPSTEARKADWQQIPAKTGEATCQ